MNEMLKRKEEIKNLLITYSEEIDENAIRTYINEMFNIENWSNEKLRKGINKIWIDINNNIKIEFKFGNNTHHPNFYITGSVDISKIDLYPEDHTRVLSLNGAFNAGNRGIVEFIEVFKNRTMAKNILKRVFFVKLNLLYPTDEVLLFDYSSKDEVSGKYSSVSVKI